MPERRSPAHAVNSGTEVPHDAHLVGTCTPEWWRRAIGRAIGRVVDDVFESRKVAADRIGVDESDLGKWINASAERRPQLDVLLAVPELRTPLLLALGKLDGAIEIVTQFRSRPGPARGRRATDLIVERA